MKLFTQKSHFEMFYKLSIIFLIFLPILESFRLLIIAGKNVNIVNFPYQLSLFSNGSFTCGAFLISKSFALTAGKSKIITNAKIHFSVLAHCIKNQENNSVRAGSSYRLQNGILVNISKVIKHPKFNLSTFDYDFAILKLKSPLTLSSTIRTIKMANKKDVLKIGTKCTISGFGLTSVGPTYTDQLHSTTVEITDIKQCKAVYLKYGFNITDQMFCAGSVNTTVPEGNPDACLGDSGGPLVFNSTVFGVISVGIGNYVGTCFGEFKF